MRPLVALALALLAGGCQDGTGSLLISLQSNQPLKMVALLRVSLSQRPAVAKTEISPMPPVDIGPQPQSLVLVTPRGRSGSAELEVIALTPLTPGKEPTEVIGIARQMVTLKPGATTDVTLRFGEIAVGGDMTMPPADLGGAPDLTSAPDLAVVPGTCQRNQDCDNKMGCKPGLGCACFQPMGMPANVCVPKCNDASDCPMGMTFKCVDLPPHGKVCAP